ncbi:hypothetical protein L3Q82_024411 [Scortum barcoo]|uniref:Uncharacterized protein n=1 Tax=Scortum barcoo TaxID=214431 RepID=A0ACB8WT14_9TELE|nr:hypothetical protein L3Q82_024411 [Scortum barcoo]
MMKCFGWSGPGAAGLNPGLVMRISPVLLCAGLGRLEAADSREGQTGDRNGAEVSHEGGGGAGDVTERRGGGLKQVRGARLQVEERKQEQESTEQVSETESSQSSSTGWIVAGVVSTLFVVVVVPLVIKLKKEELRDAASGTKAAPLDPADWPSSLTNQSRCRRVKLLIQRHEGGVMLSAQMMTAMELLPLVCLCLLTCSAAASADGNEPVKVIVMEDSDAILPCSLGSGENIESRLFDWRKDYQKDGSKDVFMYDGKKQDLLRQSAAPEPYVTIIKTDHGALLQCFVRGASPKPQLQWQDSDGNLVPAKDPQEEKRGGSYNIILQATVTKTETYRCVVTQKEINHQTQAEIYGPPIGGAGEAAGADGLTVSSMFEPVLPQPATKITLSNVPPLISDAF